MATIHQFARKSETATLRCTSCGKTTDAACSCGAPYEYIAPGELAAKAVAANPGKSNRKIAADLGVDESTVREARKSTAGNPAVEKRTGKDGKTRRMPRKKSAPKRHARADDVIGRADANMSYKDIAADTEVGARQVRHIVEEEQIWRAAQAELLDAAASENFSEKGKLKIDDAIRIHKARLDKQFEQRVNDEVRRRIDAADDATRKQAKELHLQNINLQRIVSQRGVFTEKQFKQMQMLCHPDNSASPQVKAELSQILVENKTKLVKPD